ncbi:MAG: hypothetical protein WC663_03525 [Patescibacteria group bacterium]|jgi:hypothetical protein
MFEKDKIEVSFDYTLAHSLLEIVREQLGEQHPLLDKMIAAIDQHTCRKAKLVKIVLSDRAQLNDFRNILAQLISRATKLNEEIRVH